MSIACVVRRDINRMIGVFAAPVFADVKASPNNNDPFFLVEEWGTDAISEWPEDEITATFAMSSDALYSWQKISGVFALYLDLRANKLVSIPALDQAAMEAVEAILRNTST